MCFHPPKTSNTVYHSIDINVLIYAYTQWIESFCQYIHHFKQCLKFYANLFRVGRVLLLNHCWSTTSSLVSPWKQLLENLHWEGEHFVLYMLFIPIHYRLPTNLVHQIQTQQTSYFKTQSLTKSVINLLLPITICSHVQEVVNTQTKKTNIKSQSLHFWLPPPRQHHHLSLEHRLIFYISHLVHL
jgi:hypothetical protein